MYVQTFAILEFVYDLITKSGLPARKATERVLIHCFQSFETFACNTHEAVAGKKANSTEINIYFNNKRKTCIDSVATDGVKTLREDRVKEKRVPIKICCFYFYFRLI